MAHSGLVEQYLTLGLRLGRHIDGLVDAYYGPPDRSALVDAEPVQPPEQLVAAARLLVAAIDSGAPLDLSTPDRGRLRPRPSALAAGPGGRSPDHRPQAGR